jgi:predicted metal-dependent hydrolase
VISRSPVIEAPLPLALVSRFVGAASQPCQPVDRDCAGKRRDGMIAAAISSESERMGRYQIRRSGRARRLRITVRPAGVEVVAPLDARDAEIAAFVQGNQRWIETRLAAIRQRLAAHQGSSRLADGARIPFRGGWQRLRVFSGSQTRSRVRHAGDIWVELADRLPAALQESEVERVLTGWLRREARAEAKALVDRYGPRHRLVPRGLVIKAHRTLWGSCTASDVINLNWRLILAPPAVLEYVVVHELCHLRHRHHQPPFWRLVAELLPDYGRQRRWLRANGHLLTLKPEPIAHAPEGRGAPDP